MFSVFLVKDSVEIEYLNYRNWKERLDERERLVKIWLIGVICWLIKISDNKHLLKKMAVKSTSD